jgi:hypothetical protein
MPCASVTQHHRRPPVLLYHTLLDCGPAAMANECMCVRTSVSPCVCWLPQVGFAHRGGSSFADKTRTAQARGCIALVVAQNNDVWPYTMTDSASNGAGVTIPVVMVRKEHGARLQGHLPPAPTAATAHGSTSSGSDTAACTITLRQRPTVQSCVVCQEAFETGCSITQLPCQHLFHSPCVTTWLKVRNSCPVCRWELPTGDKAYDERRASSGTTEASFSSWYG